LKRTLNEVINIKTKIYLHLSSLITVLFIIFYNKRVCPFIDNLSVISLLFNLSIVSLIHISVKEILYSVYTVPQKGRSIARHGYFISIISWCIGGVAALIIHYLRYPDFPLGSHLKLLSSYWILGACILGQLEYVVLERVSRKYIQELRKTKKFVEGVERRLVEAFFMFTLAPSLIMILVVLRYVYEKLIDRGVAVELTYIGAYFVVIALVVAIEFGRSIKKDTNEILKGIDQIEKGYLGVNMDITRIDELGKITSGINNMSQGLLTRERIKEAFGRFVDPGVASEFIDKYITHKNEFSLGGEKKTVAVLMCDIRDFTPLSESIEAEDLTDLLNKYFSEMVVAIQKNSGVVDKFIGDAIMAVFGFLDCNGNCALDAVNAAKDMQNSLIKFNDKRKELGQCELKIGIGIHYGKVIAGYIGSPERLEYTVIGSTVNIAARIESQAKLPLDQQNDQSKYII